MRMTNPKRLMLSPWKMRRRPMTLMRLIDLDLLKQLSNTTPLEDYARMQTRVVSPVLSVKCGICHLLLVYV